MEQLQDQQSNQTLPTQTEENNRIQAKDNPYKIRVIEAVMIFIFLLFAIPMYLFIIKMRQRPTSGQINNEQQEVTIVEITPNPIQILSITDVQSSLNKLDSLDPKSFEATKTEISSELEKLSR